MFKLVAVEGDNQHLLDKARVTVGRAEDCDIHIAEDKISKLHAQFIIEQNTVTIEDLNSTNGTFVNNRQIESQRSLSAGDVIRFESIAYYLALQTDEALTVLARNMPQNAPGPGLSKIAVEAEASSDTVFEQDYSLPAHWPSAENDPMFTDRVSKYTPAAVDRMLSKHLVDRDDVATVLVVMSESHSPPLFGLKVTKPKHHWTLGRASDQSISLTNMSVSANHATLIYDNGRWAIRDENSSNQVKVNNKTQKLCPVVDGDVIALGKVELVFRALP